jgi:endonuclease V-like protein UPF0215 family
MQIRHPHVLGIDDAPFKKRQRGEVPIVAVMMQGSTLVEGVAVSSFPVDGDEATDYLAAWVLELRWLSALQAVVLGGITIAGLGIIDLAELARRLELPVIAATRRDTSKSELRRALVAAGLGERVEILERAPPARQLEEGLFVASAGVEDAAAAELVRATLAKAKLPEPLRLAHLIGAALTRGQSRGRV